MTDEQFKALIEALENIAEAIDHNTDAIGGIDSTLDRKDFS